MKALLHGSIPWQRIRNWMVNLGALWFVLGILYMMLTGQFRG